ncbi:amidase, partial [Streptomyces sp. SID10244]|nr:amidase [Streptomyces sp. SID10244]
MAEASRSESGPSLGPSVAEILESHVGGSGSPTRTARSVADAVEARGDDGTWLSTVPRAELLSAAAELERRPGARGLPLYGVPFGVKDSIDVAGVSTTLSCPDYAYVADRTAPVVQRLLDAGALYVGKTNLDQFATGLNGTRTPYTIPRSVYGGEMISGGSSSGSAVAVALGQVPFAV